MARPLRCGRRLSLSRLCFHSRRLGGVTGAEPSLILLDEPASGLNQEETDDVSFWLDDIKHDLGVTIVMVEHDMGLVERVADRVMAINNGKLLTIGTPDAVRNNPAVQQAYLGTAA